jgi:methylated-DNA-[protein]-cysteine S-methyltransferase
MYYQIIKVGKESIGLVWDWRGKKPQIEKIYLPAHPKKMISRINQDYPAVNTSPCKIGRGVERLIAGLYLGKKQKINLLSLLNMKKLTPFARKVLLQTFKIPRGGVVSYSDLAKKIGKRNAARAVGRVMAANPFPLIVPCHRVIRADGKLGGFGGGLEMKKNLLAKEGIHYTSKEKFI